MGLKLRVYYWFSSNRDNRSYCGLNVKTTRLKCRTTRKDRGHGGCICHFACFAFVVGENQNIPNLSPMADHEITLGGICLGSPLYFCDLDKQLLRSSCFNTFCPLYTSMWRPERQTEFKITILS